LTPAILSGYFFRMCVLKRACVCLFFSEFDKQSLLARYHDSILRPRDIHEVRTIYWVTTFIGRPLRSSLWYDMLSVVVCLSSVTHALWLNGIFCRKTYYTIN